MSVTKQQQVFICGKHRFKTTDISKYHLHIIDDHDTEHGLWQEAGTFKFHQRKPIEKNGKMVYGKREIYFGNFRYLPTYQEINCNCRCNTGTGCWQGNKCFDPEMHKTKTPEEYKAWVDKKWSRK